MEVLSVPVLKHVLIIAEPLNPQANDQTLGTGDTTRMSGWRDNVLPAAEA